jgi:hypothetical protein
MFKKSILLTVCALLVIAAASMNLANANSTSKNRNAQQATELVNIASEAYTFLYPLVMMEITRRVSTNSEAGTEVGRGPMNTLVNMRKFPDANFKDVVRPNFDTLYSVIWMDVSQEPMVLSIGDTKGRYYLLPLIDMWSNVIAVPGKRTSGTAAKSFVIVKQGWTGSLPPGVDVIVSPTSILWMIGRLQTNGPSDYAAVNSLQDTIKWDRLSDWKVGKDSAFGFQFDSSVDMKTPPLQQVNTMPVAQYFQMAAELIKNNPPQITDWSVLERMKKLGFVVGQNYDLSKQTPEVQAAVATGAKLALNTMFQKVPTIAKVVNGWQMNTDTMGVYGNFYLKRAIVAMVGLGANQPEDAIYPMAVADADGDVMVGEQDYLLHFEKSELPPVGAFWSVTMYDESGFPVANELNRYAIGDRDALIYNADGSLDIYIQHKNPGGSKTANWLPSPAGGKLGVTMRLYAPMAPALDGRWAPASIKKN